MAKKNRFRLRLAARRRLRRRNRSMRKSRFASLRWRPFALGMLMTAIVITLQVMDFNGLKAVNEAAFDQYQRWKPRQLDDSVPVAVVDIDVRSLEELGQWPWPRTEIAELTLRLAAHLTDVDRGTALSALAKLQDQFENAGAAPGGGVDAAGSDPIPQLSTNPHLQIEA